MMRTTAVKHKHLKLNQKKIDFAKRYFGVKVKQEAIGRALSLLMEEEQLVKALTPLQMLGENTSAAGRQECERTCSDA